VACYNMPPRTSSYVGKKKITSKPSYRKAYKNKKKTSSALGPIRETKKLQDWEVFAQQRAGTGLDPYKDPRSQQNVNAMMANISPQCSNFKIQGLGDNMMIGSSCFARYLSQKVKIIFPQGENIPIVPQSAWLIHGWVIVPYGSSTTLGARDPANMSVQELRNYVTEQVKPWFNERNDELEFRTKQNSNIRVIKKQLIKPRSKNTSWTAYGQSMPGDTNEVITNYPNSSAVVDSSRVYNLKWPMMTKIHHTAFSGNPLPTAMFNDFDRIPFTIIYQPEFDSIMPDPDVQLDVVSNGCFWYSDV